MTFPASHSDLLVRVLGWWAKALSAPAAALRPHPTLSHLFPVTLHVSVSHGLFTTNVTLGETILAALLLQNTVN